MSAKLTIIVIITLLVLLVLAQNARLIELKFLFWHFSVSRLIFLPLLVSVGLIVGFALGRRSRRRS